MCSVNTQVPRFCNVPCAKLVHKHSQKSVSGGGFVA